MLCFCTQFPYNMMARCARCLMAHSLASLSVVSSNSLRVVSRLSALRLSQAPRAACCHTTWISELASMVAFVLQTGFADLYEYLGLLDGYSTFALRTCSEERKEGLGLPLWGCTFLLRLQSSRVTKGMASARQVTEGARTAVTIAEAHRICEFQANLELTVIDS